MMPSFLNSICHARPVTVLDPTTVLRGSCYSLHSYRLSFHRFLFSPCGRRWAKSGVSSAQTWLVGAMADPPSDLINPTEDDASSSYIYLRGRRAVTT